jgi:hypothetical protein
MQDRNEGCPVCGFKLLCREGDEIICLASTCDWRIVSKREADKEIPLINKLKQEWYQ